MFFALGMGLFLSLPVTNAQENLVPDPHFNTIKKNGCKFSDYPYPNDYLQFKSKYWFDRFSHQKMVDGTVKPTREGIEGYHGNCHEKPMPPFSPLTGKGMGKIQAFDAWFNGAFIERLDTVKHELFNKYLFTFLRTKLKKDHQYYLYFNARMDTSTTAGINKLGAKLFNDQDSTALTEISHRKLKQTLPQVYAQSTIPVSKNGVGAQSFYKVAGTFTASEASYNVLGLGIFFPMKEVDTLHLRYPFYPKRIDKHRAYYCIDDVGLYEVPRVMSSRDTTVCRGDSVPIVLKGGQPYYLSKKSHPNDTLSTDSITWVQPEETTTYYINSVIKDSVKVHVFDSSKNILEDRQGFCPGQSISLNKDHFPGIRHEWSTGDTTPVLQVDEPGTYVLHSRAGSCETRDTTEVYQEEAPTPLEITGERALCPRKDEEVTLSIQNSNYQSFEWAPIGRSGSRITLSDTGRYKVIGEYWNGCKEEEEFTIASSCSTSFYVPNAFSPNGDGTNDQFCPEGLDVTNYRLRIYNRFGEKLFESTALDNCWDGTYQGETVPEGTYIYTIEYTHKEGTTRQYHQFKDGTIHVIK